MKLRQTIVTVAITAMSAMAHPSVLQEVSAGGGKEQRLNDRNFFEARRLFTSGEYKECFSFCKRMFEIDPGNSLFTSMLVESAIRTEEYKYVQFHWPEFKAFIQGDIAIKEALVFLKSGNEKHARELQLQSFLDTDIPSWKISKQYISTKDSKGLECYLFLTLAFSSSVNRQPIRNTYVERAKAAWPSNPLPYLYAGKWAYYRDTQDKKAIEDEFSLAWKFGDKSIQSYLKGLVRSYGLKLSHVSGEPETPPS